MECAGKGRGSRCVGPPIRRCAHCAAVAYCSLSHQISHWKDHKKECERLEEQMRRADALHDFPFTYSQDTTLKVCEKQETRCSFLVKQGLHQEGMWKYECHCGASITPFDSSRFDDSWNLPKDLCPCTGPKSPLSSRFNSWRDYYEWRCIPLHSPVALLLHWPLTIFYATQLAVRRGLIPEIGDQLHIHYLGPEKELFQLAVFGELCALFPGVKVHMELIGPAIPLHRDGEEIDLCGYAHCVETSCECKSSSEKVGLGSPNYRASAVTLLLRKGLYHDCYSDIVKNSSPDIIVAPNAGIAAYSSWIQSIELIENINVPAIFTDYCEEAVHLAASCISSITGHSLTTPIQLNPFRQPMAVEDSVLFLPCYSNCFLFGISGQSKVNKDLETTI
ncbi:Mitochondrial splicing suppressor 51-like, C-terminal domain [Dillenia turbinata]|uniref:Mitochondrial splicing suppressor 51-like, C-terminal domain n=1 Tax=Dillenia turbinata TaxID=194707 RepID=A0AAN8ZAM3_9MAGN